MSILDQLPPVIKQGVSLEDVKVQDEPTGKTFILACSRLLTPEEQELLKLYGRLLMWDSSFRNIPLKSHKADYIVFNLMEKVHRDTLAKEDMSDYHVVCIVGLLDSYDDFAKDIGAVNLVRTFPARQAFKGEFDRLLLSPKIRKPSLAKTLLRFLCGLAHGLESK